MSQSKLRKRAEARKALDALREAFPAAFTPEGHPPKPLAIGTRERLLDWVKDQPGLTADAVTWALQRYCWLPVYRTKLVAGAVRYALDGAADGAVTAEQQALAEAALKAVQDNQREAEKRSAKREAHHQAQQAAEHAAAQARKAEMASKAAERAARRAKAKQQARPPAPAPAAAPVLPAAPKPAVIVKVKKRRTLTR